MFSGANAQISQCTAGKTTSLPFAGDFGAPGAFAITRHSIANPDPEAPAPTSVFIPSNATSANKVPVVFFSHGYGGTSFLFYENLMRQLASNGYIVVFSPYTASIPVTHATRYGQLWGGFLAAIQQNSSIIDTTKIGFAGHSYGAGATPDMARRAVAQGWGANGLFMFIMAPWYNWGTSMEQIPASAKMIVQVYWDDTTNQHLIGQMDIWNKIPQITDRKWQLIRATQTYCSLDAGHSVPVTDGLSQTNGVNDSYDAWGVWRRLHALANYTFTGNLTAKNVAYGVDSSMGKWRGIFAVRQIPPIETYDSPVVNASTTPTFLWANKCLFASGAPCP